MIDATPRHLLVIATQCAVERDLAELNLVAAELFDVLTEPELGAADGRMLSRPATKVDVETEVRQAINRAGMEGAVLVIAFLGHGFTPPKNTTLYYMASDTRPEEPASGVDVGRLMAEAVQQPGIAGVIGLIDTCYAAGGVPDLRSVIGGVGDGLTKVAALAAAAAHEAAFDLNLTRALVDVLRAGIIDTSDVLHVNDALVLRLREKLRRQTPVWLSFDGSAATGPLWLARNRGCLAAAARGGVGTLGHAELSAAISAWSDGYQLPGTWTPDALNELRNRAAESSAPGSRHVVRVVDAVIYAWHAAEFVRGDLGAALTTTAMRGAVRRAGLHTIAAATGSTLLVTLLEEVALRVARVRRSPWEPLATFLAALAIETGTARDHPGLRRWARRCGLEAELNDAFTVLATMPARADLRLVLSLADGFTGWPDTVEAWLLRPGETSAPQQSFTCRRNDQPSTEDAILQALEWARAATLPGESLRFVDIASPSHLLAEWCPEEANGGLYLLGVWHDVLAQWSGRLQPNRMQPDMNDSARRSLREMDRGIGIPLDWVTRADLLDQAAFLRKLKSGWFRRAIGVDHRPSDLAGVLEMLLPYSPILVWPATDSCDGTWPDAVRDSWSELPDEFTNAYRTRLRGQVAPLAYVRTAWHDDAWLEFSRRFERRAVQAPETFGSKTSSTNESEP